MTQEHIDENQTKRIDKLEQEVIFLRVKFAEILTKMDTLLNVGKVVAIVAGAAVGIDIIPMIN